MLHIKTLRAAFPDNHRLRLESSEAMIERVVRHIRAVAGGDFWGRVCQLRPANVTYGRGEIGQGEMNERGVRI